MREIKQLNSTHIDEYLDIAYNSYPSFKDNSKEGRDAFKRLIEVRMDDKTSKYIGMFEDDILISAMRIINFRMNYFNETIDASGLASLGVHLMYKKQRIAKEMVDYYEQHYLEKDTPIASLLPFTPEFYKKMGYGLGPKMNQYRLKCDRLPSCYDNADIRYINTNQIDSLLDCHHRFCLKTHGMFNKMNEEILDLQENCDNKIVANYNDKGIMDGYLVFVFENGKDDNYTINNVRIKELVYENVTALNRLIGFLRKQADQVNLVIFNTQDEYFAHLIDNPLNDSLNYIDYGNLETNTQAIGIMYKILDIPKAFEQCSFRNYNNVNLKTRFMITDENKVEKEYIIHFVNGKASIAQSDYTCTIKIKSVDFASLFMGCISIKGLEHLGLLEIDKQVYLNEIDLAFYCSLKPICNTDF